MPVESLVVVTFVVAMFAAFMVAVGGVWIWTNLPHRAPRRVRPAPARGEPVAAR